VSNFKIVYNSIALKLKQREEISILMCVAHCSRNLENLCASGKIFYSVKKMLLLCEKYTDRFIDGRRFIFNLCTFLISYIAAYNNLATNFHFYFKFHFAKCKFITTFFVACFGYRSLLCEYVRHVLVLSIENFHFKDTLFLVLV